MRRLVRLAMALLILFALNPTLLAQCLPAPTLIAPDDGGTVPFGPVTLSWHGVTNALAYEVWVGLEGATPEKLDQTTQTSLTRTIGPGRLVSWKIRAIGPASCAGSFSEERGFETSCPAAGPALNDPPDQERIAPGEITFFWSQLPGAVSYDLELRTDADWFLAAENLTSTSKSLTLPAGDYRWRVRANFDSCEPQRSEERHLLVGVSCGSNPEPSLLLPLQNESVELPLTFRWSSVEGASGYRLWVQRDGHETPRLLTTTAGTQYTSTDLSAGKFDWWVEASFPGCPDEKSNERSFVIERQVTCPTQLGLLGPADGATVSSPVSLSWESIPGTDGYRVWISHDDSAPMIIARTMSASATISLPSGQIEWWVEAMHPLCPLRSAERRFIVAAGTSCGTNAAPTLVSPAGTFTDPADAGTPTTLTWTAPAGAIGYRVWIAERGDDGFEDIALTRETSVTLTLEADVYAWFVQALFDGCPSIRSAVAVFETFAQVPRCSTEAPSPLSPTGNASATSPVTFSWSPVEGAEKYRVFASINGAEAILVAATEDTSITRVLPPGSVSWKVEASFEDCASTVSSAAHFTVASAANCSGASATLVAPAADATLTHEVAFSWNAVPGAVRYALLARVNDGSATVLKATTETEASVAVPAGEIDWWIVTFFAGCEPTESDHRKLTVTRNRDCPTARPVILLPSGEAPRVTSPVHMQWSAVPGASSYRIWARQADGPFALVDTVLTPEVVAAMGGGPWEWFVESVFPSCESTRSALAECHVVPDVPCGTPETPTAWVVGQAMSNTKYRVRWTPLPNVGLYEVQESTTTDFANATTLTTGSTAMTFTHEGGKTPLQYLYRVRGVSDCNDSRGTYSDPIGVFVMPQKSANASMELGSGEAMLQSLFVPGGPAPLAFTATTDKPWMTVSPAAGTIPPEGITLEVSTNPQLMVAGTNTGTVKLQYASNANGGPQTHAGTTSSIPLSVSLVTPVAPAGKGTPPPDSLIFPVVGHAQGVNDSLFESDIRLTNLSAQLMKYQLNYTPSGVDGTQTGSSNTIELAPNETMALDDIVSSVFGSGTTSSSVGMLEVRPMTTWTNTTSALMPSSATSLIRDLVTAASSRTYNFTPSGTFGQFIPATRFADFIGRQAAGAAPQILSLQQVSQSAAFRANFGFAEASGNAANLLVRVYDTASTLVATIPVALQPLEHLQLNGMLQTNGINDLTDGRVEVEVTSGEGKVTAYVSTVDNKTNDPLLVSPVVKGGLLANRWVVPGVAFLENASAFWVSDLRVFNAGSEPTPATITFFPAGNPAGAVSRELTLDAGEIEVLDNVLAELFGQPSDSGGAIAISTPQDAPLTVTARTYNQTANGTYGQYIPGVTPAESVGLGDRALQLLQLEQSSRFRTNIGVVETSGQPATVEMRITIPDSITTPVVTIPLAGNEFRQIPLSSFGITDAVYNARVSVKVIEGNGRVTAYGSAIDEITQDPTYVPAQ